MIKHTNFGAWWQIWKKHGQKQIANALKSVLNGVDYLDAALTEHKILNLSFILLQLSNAQTHPSLGHTYKNSLEIF